MILKLFLWLFPIFLISFDKVFLDLIVLFPLYFYFESVVEFSFEKALRYVLYLSLYSFVIYGKFNLLYVILIFVIIIFDSTKEYWLRIWLVPLFESCLFLLPLAFAGFTFSYVLSLIVALIIFLILRAQKIIVYK
ncbi:MAG: hypothetical protein H0Z24_01705 [Thermosipho sp. (in: Bacteria)]|nr:hypothetical protein [Thermosipho sp. (in: thermotogales)]